MKSGPLITLLMVFEALPWTGAAPNVVIFIADDLGYGDVGCFGNTTLNTPNIDRLAKEGAKLTHHLAAASMCSPSRTALLTGRYPVRSGEHNVGYYCRTGNFMTGASYGDIMTGATCGAGDAHSSGTPDLAFGFCEGMVPSGQIRINLFVGSPGGLPPSEVTIAELAQSVGYKTALVGKWHLGISRTFGDNVHHPNNQGFDMFYGLPLTNLRDFGDEGDSIFREFFPKWRWGGGAIILIGVLTACILYRNAYVGRLCLIILLILSIFPIGTFYLIVTNMKILNSMVYQNFDIIEQPIRLTGMTQRFAQESIEFLEKRKQDKTPFLLVVSWTHVHTAIQVTKQFRGRTRHGRYGDAVEEMDSGIGDVMSALDRLGLSEDTVVYFTSDNGGFLEERGTRGEVDGGYNGIFKGGKGHGAVEGGIRMPGVLRWPGSIAPGTVIDEPTWMMDMYPTLARAMGARLPGDRPIDGRDLLPLVTGEETVSPHTFMVHYCGDDIHAIRYRPRTGNRVWKLVLRSPNYIPGTTTCLPICNCDQALIHAVPLLYDLASDPAEANLIQYIGNPDLEKVVAEMTVGLNDHMTSVEPVEIQFSTRNILWRPHLQVCCNFPYCQCKDTKYSDYD